MTSTQPDPAPRHGYSRRFFWLTVFIVVLFGGYAAAWFVIADRVEKGIDRKIAELRAEDGVIADCEKRRIGGFPFRFELFCDRVAFDDPRAPVTLQAGAMRSARQIYDLRHTVGELDGPLTFTAPLDIELSWSALRASVRDSRPLPERISITASEVSAVTKPATLRQPLFTASAIEAHMRTNGPDVDIASDFTDLAIDPAAVEGRAIPALSGVLDAAITGGVVLAETKPLSLRGQSGTIRRMELAAGEGRIIVSGPIAFDADGLANGELEVTVENPRAVSQVFQTAIPEQADNIRTGFQAMQFLGNRPSLPLRLKRGEARFGFVKLGRFPAVD